jgi:hypothetical protein
MLPIRQTTRSLLVYAGVSQFPSARDPACLRTRGTLGCPTAKFTGPLPNHELYHYGVRQRFEI